MTSELSEKILEYLSKCDEIDSLDLAKIFQEDHQKVIGAIKSLQAIGNLINANQVNTKRWELTEEGQHVLKFGSHEAAVYNAISENGSPQAEIMKTVTYAKVGLSKALAAGWVEIDKNDKSVVKRKVASIIDTPQVHLMNLSEVPENIKKEYKKRKFLQEVVIKSVLLSKGESFSTKVEKQEADVTADLLVNDAWKEKKFKPYNFDALGSALDVGHLHPLLKVRAEFRKIFLEMGFTEMPTNNYVESSFWNFDALFQPQQHPARDAHDTFFVAEPKLSTCFPENYLKKVKEVHSVGGYGSQGYRYDWKFEEAQKNLLRTHTTAVSARMLYKLMQDGEFKPVKYFSIDRVFRNETLDATHLAEFHQIEGVVADFDLSLGDLIGTLYEFFSKLGITQLEFKPAYNPYTEPSMEIFCFHNGLGKWIEIGNSGIFRPEMLLPMGLPENVNVIAWGLSLERPTMIKYGLNNIRDLVGPKVDLQMVHDNPLCRLDKNDPRSVQEKRRKSDELSKSIVNQRQETCVQDIVIFCDPKYPLYTLETLLSIFKRDFSISVSVHSHSSVQKLPDHLVEFCSEFRTSRKNVDFEITFIWKIVGVDPQMQISAIREFSGETNIARFLNRLVEERKPNLLRYESNGALYAYQIDAFLDRINESLHCLDSKNKLKNLRALIKGQYLMGDEISIADIVLQSICRNLGK
ncbi:phenylalanine--tRNA ligase alpha subunit [Belonocnema kinseyi]|uniref:phenylalanine--tRNA ligase alpha subunit n=1 Tax=Belonocnema kinseyi TaxID=2817044 RepID=UPI00143CDD36|nr:phenylalanine--tRNA ligase alpha subunit [Belonocnema kinseyi]